MPTVETTIRLSIPRGGMSWESLEAQVAEVVRAAGQRLLVAAAGALEGELLKDVPLRPEKRRSLDLLTGFGWIRLERWQVREQATGRYCYPLDQALGLGPRQHASPEVVAQAAALASRIPYRQAALLLGRWLGEAVDHRTLYAWVQRAGVQVVAEEDEGQEAVFGRGQEAPRDPTEREIVVTEVDGTFLKAQREGVPEFEVRLGVLYSGKEQESPTAKHRSPESSLRPLSASGENPLRGRGGRRGLWGAAVPGRGGQLRP